MPVLSCSHLLILKCSWTRFGLCSCISRNSGCTEYLNISFMHIFSLLTGRRSRHRINHRSITCVSEHNERGSCLWEAKADRWSGPEHAPSVLCNYKKGICWISLVHLIPKHRHNMWKEIFNCLCSLEMFVETHWISEHLNLSRVERAF